MKHWIAKLSGGVKNAAAALRRKLPFKKGSEDIFQDPTTQEPTLSSIPSDAPSNFQQPSNALPPPLPSETPDVYSVVSEEPTRDFAPRAKTDWKERLLPMLEDGRERFQKFIQKRGARYWGTVSTIVLSTFFLSDLVSLMIERLIPEPPTPRASSTFAGAGGKSAADFDSIIARNLFNSQGKIADEGDVVPDNTPVRTTLPLNLIGTVVLQEATLSLATIEDRSASRTYPVRVDDEIPGKIKVMTVEARRVTFQNLSSRRVEFVELPEDRNQPSIMRAAAPTGTKPAIQQTASNKFSIPRTELETALSPANFNRIITEARAVPYKDGGYQLFQIVPGSIYETLGLKNGDVIKGFNGEPINDPAKAFSLLSSIKDAKSGELQIERGGKAVNMVYDIN
jgi:general secretion pathway protein C